MKTVSTVLKRRIPSLLLAVVLVLGMLPSGLAASYYVVHPAEGDYILSPEASSGFALDVSGGGDAPAQTPIQLWEKNNSDAQIFTLDQVSGDWYRLIHKRTGLVMNIQGGTNANDARIWLWPDDGTDSCYFRFIQVGSSYAIQSKLGDQRFIDLDNAQCFNGSIVHLWDMHFGLSARWKLIPLSTTGTTMYVRTSSSSSKLNMRTAPNTGASILAKLTYGTAVTVHSTTNGWSRITTGGKTGYVSSQYLSAQKPVVSTLTSPVPAGAKFSRKSSDNGFYGYHDINRGISSSTPVYAITDGTAYFYQYHTNNKLRSYGNCVRFVSSDGTYEVIYAHLKGFKGVSTPITTDSAYPCSGAASKEAVGTLKVTAGQTLGWIGTTGNSSGLHLHIEVYRNGTRIDPTVLFPQLI